jgi:bifunctional oligoribonuclease and PAP phosphatase NrnA
MAPPPIPPPILDSLGQARSVALISHQRPDGDAIGSIIGLGRALRTAGKEVTLYNENLVPQNLRFLEGHEEIRQADPKPADVALALDTANKARLGQLGHDLFALAKTTLNVDHHVSNEGYGDASWIDPAAAATAEMAFFLAKALDLSLDHAATEALYVGISTDTGSFQYANTSARTMEVAAALVAAGLNVGQINLQLYRSYPLRRVHLLHALLDDLRLEAAGTVASWTLPLDLQKNLAISPGDTEGLADIMRGIDSVRASASFEEQPSGEIRVSARSNLPHIDVGKVCAQFGGGGHPMAAGATLPGPLVEARERFVNALVKAAS